MVEDKRGRTLTDLRISLTDRCNLRCTYCMPKEIFGASHVFLKKNQWLNFSELDELVEAFVQLGVTLEVNLSCARVFIISSKA